MKKMIERLRHCAEQYDCTNCECDDGDRCVDNMLALAADSIEKLNTWNDELIKEVEWLKSCKNCKIYADCPRHGCLTVHGCDHWVDACGERKDNER